MNIEHIKQFVEVVESGSIRKAANRLYLSESTISYTIKMLESYYGVKLFERNNGKLLLNKYGQAFLEYSKSCLLSDEYIRKRFIEIKEQEKQKINLAVYTHYFQNFALDSIKLNCDGFHFETYVMDEETAFACLEDGSIDAAILLDPKQHTEYKGVSIYKEQLEINVLSTNILVSSKLLSMEDLRYNKFFYAFKSDVYSKWVNDLLLSNGIQLNQIIEMPKTEHLDNKADNSYCAFTTTFIASFVPYPANTVVIPIKDELATKRVKLCYKPENEDRLQKLIAYLIRHGRELAGNPLFLASLIGEYGDK